MPAFQYSLNSSTIRPAPILDKIRIAGEAGYAGIELWHDDIDAYLAGGGKLADIKSALADAGLKVPMTIYIKGWIESIGPEHQRVLDLCKQRMACAAELGAPHIIAGPPGGRCDRDQAARHYRELLDVGRSFGVKPAMEYLGFVDDINTIEAALEIMDKSGHPDATIVHDPFHIFRGGGSFDSITKVPAHRIAICHFNDAPAHPSREQQHDKDRVYPGDGHVDLRRLIRLLEQVGYNRWLSLELFNPALWERDPREVARVGLEKMRAVVESA